MKNITVALFVFAVLGCADDGISVPPSFALHELLAAPDTIQVEGRVLYLTTSLNRDFMPITPPGGSALTAVVYVTATDTTKLSSGISLDAMWVVYEEQVWSSWLADGINSTGQQNRIVKLARDGPKWGPNVYVTVIVRVRDSGGKSFLLRASDQPIGATS